MDYKIATTVPEALEFLSQANGTGRIIAGGTDLMVQLKEERISVATLVDVSRIKTLQSITTEHNRLIIGSAVTHTEVIHSSEIAKYLPALTRAVGSIGARQVRNLGTLAGNIVTGNPEADGALMLNALGASLQVVGPNGERTVSLEDLYDSNGHAQIDSTKELITAICVPLPEEGEYAAYVRTSLRKAMTPALVNVAVSMKVHQGKVERVRIAMAPVAPRPKRAWTAEKWLAGKELTQENILQCTKLALEDADPSDNPFRGSRAYQLQLLGVLVKRALFDAASQSGQTVAAM